ncbi:MFS transporter [Paraburkholderia sp. 22B1P]|uniref:MFS transporter n=1 Tax=Paraburkholderia sp. 22B1P TaxID=3080498 RepID=UPI0030CD4F2A
MFRSLRSHNYRLWASSAIVSNIGTWMQRTAQDWLVLTGLTHQSASAVGTVMALQFAPQILLITLTGFAADHFNRRKLIFVTQGALGLLALVLGVLTLTKAVQLWEVYGFAFLLGCVTAFDTPARQTFVAELVDETNLANAVALNSTSFNIARMIGPAIAGLLISTTGAGWVFIINAASFGVVLVTMSRFRVSDLHRKERARRGKGSLMDGFRYVWHRRDLRTVLIMLFLIGTFGLNFPIFITTMSVTIFHVGANRYGLLMSMMAVGSVLGALLSARREKPTTGILFLSSAVFGVGCTVAAVMPSYWLFGMALTIVGVAAQTVTTSTNSYVQLSTEPKMRGRVIAILLAAALGGTPIGAPIVGWIADHIGPRWALGVGALAGLAGALTGLVYVRRRTPASTAITDPARFTGDLSATTDQNTPITNTARGASR